MCVFKRFVLYIKYYKYVTFEGFSLWLLPIK